MSVDPTSLKRAVNADVYDPRSAARLAAVQALFQMEVTGVGASAAAEEFVAHRFREWYSEPDDPRPDEELFRAIVLGVAQSQARLDKAVSAVLRKDWRLSRIDPTLRAILRAGAYELSAPGGPGPAVLINDYVDVARAFFEKDEPGFVNAALDALARQGL